MDAVVACDSNQPILRSAPVTRDIMPLLPDTVFSMIKIYRGAGL